MPRFPALRVGVLAELARQLRFEPPAAARRHLARAEDLARQFIDDAEQAAPGFPEEWIVYRITGLREMGVTSEPDRGPSAEPALVVREAVISDLPALIDRLSAAAELTPAEHAGPRWLSVQALCERWGVSRKTLERYRRRGLVSRRVLMGGGRQRVLFNLSIVESFEQRFQLELDASRRFTRLSDADRRRIIARAARYRRRLGWSMHRCAQRIGPMFGRSVECVRMVLRAADAHAHTPIFDDPPVLDRSQAARLESLSRRGGRIAPVAAALRKRRQTAHRAVNVVRAERLRRLDLSGPASPLFSDPQAPSRFLAAVPARDGLGAPGPTSAAEIIALARSMDPEPAAHERARAAAYWYLLDRVRRHLGVLDRNHPAASHIDEIETLLRWASRLKAELVRSQLPLLVRTIESQAARPCESLTPPIMREVLAIGIDALIDAADRFDPFRGGRLAAPAGVAVTRAVSMILRDLPLAHAVRARRNDAAADAHLALRSIEDWTTRVHPWQRELDLTRAAREAVESLDPAQQSVIRARFGLDAGPPLTIAQAADFLALSPARVRALQRAALRILLGTRPESAR